MIRGDGGFFNRVQIDCTICRNATWWWDEAVAVKSWNRRAAISSAVPDGGKGDAADFQEGQWWVQELDSSARNGSDEFKRAVAVVHHLLRVTAAPQAECAPRALTEEEIERITCEEYAKRQGHESDFDCILKVCKRAIEQAVNKGAGE
jgi:hypothetical protein